jgi:O-antigen/teichoic acid export membrane protein
VLKQRFIAAISGNLMAQVVNIVIQLLGIPILLKYWGVNYYGEWLILFTIPGYIGISDIGLGSTATAEMSMLVADEKREEAAVILKNTFWFILSIGSIPFILLFISNFFVSWYQILHLSTITQKDFNIAFSLLILYVYLSLFLTLPLGFYRVEKIYHRERYISTAFRALEFLTFLGVVLRGGGIVEAALTFLIIRVIYFAFVIFDLKRQFAWFELTPVRFDFSKIKHLIKPSLAMMVVYLGQNLLIQGMTTIVGIKLGSEKVVIFNTTRTLMNFAKQGTSIVNLSLYSEFSYAFGMNDKNLLKRLFIRGQQLNIFLTVVSVIGLFFTGSFIMSFWTKGKIGIEEPFFSLFLITIFLNSWWNTGLAMLVAINQQKRTSIYFLLISLFILLLNFVFIGQYGLTFVSFSLILFESFMLFVIYKECSIILETPFSSLFAQTFKFFFKTKRAH